LELDNRWYTFLTTSTNFSFLPSGSEYGGEDVR
jgi:hypothetical protein